MDPVMAWFEVDDAASENHGYLMYRCLSLGCGQVMPASQLTDHKDRHTGRIDYGPQPVEIVPRFPLLRWIVWKIWDERFFILMLVLIGILIYKLWGK